MILRSTYKRVVAMSLAMSWQCVARAGYQDGVLNEEQLPRLLGYDTRLQVHAFLKEHKIPLRP